MTNRRAELLRDRVSCISKTLQQSRKTEQHQNQRVWLRKRTTIPHSHF